MLKSSQKQLKIGNKNDNVNHALCFQPPLCSQCILVRERECWKCVDCSNRQQGWEGLLLRRQRPNVFVGMLQAKKNLLRPLSFPYTTHAPICIF